jgi:hypothetical protein
MTTATENAEAFERLCAALERNAGQGFFSPVLRSDPAWNGGHSLRCFAHDLASLHPSKDADITLPFVVEACAECGIPADYRAVRDFVYPGEDERLLSPGVDCLLEFWERQKPAHRPGAPRSAKKTNLWFPEYHVSDHSEWMGKLRMVFEFGAWPSGCVAGFQEKPEGEITYAPKCYKPPKNHITPEAAAWWFVSHEAGRYALQAVYNDPNGFRVASNGRQMFAAGDPSMPEDERGKLMRPNGVFDEENQYPAWRTVMGSSADWTPRPIAGLVRPGDGVMARLAVACDINRKLGRHGLAAHAVLYDQEAAAWYLYDPLLVYNMLDAMFSLGAPSVQLKLKGGVSPWILYAGSSKAVGVTMPIRDDDGKLPACYVKLA